MLARKLDPTHDQAPNNSPEGPVVRAVGSAGPAGDEKKLWTGPLILITIVTLAFIFVAIPMFGIAGMAGLAHFFTGR